VEVDILMSKKNNNGFKKPETVYNHFNHSQKSYREYENLKSGSEKAQLELDTAGKELYTAYELGLKCYLYRRYKELYDNHVLDWRTSRDSRCKLEGDVNVGYLVKEMDKYAEPAPKDSSVNFALIKNNTWRVNNRPKHLGYDVVRSKYIESFSEIRKFIIEYIDPNPPIQYIESPRYISLQEACDYWKKDSKYNYCLISDGGGEDINTLRKIMYIDWALVFDFDSDSEKSGLSKAFSIERHIQSNRFQVDSPDKTEINGLSTVPYWFFASGLSDLPDSLVINERQWRQKYGFKLPECIRKYQAAFSKPLKVIIQGGPVNRVKDIIDALDSIYDEGGMYLYLISNEIQYEKLEDDYSEILEKYPLSLCEFSAGINNYAALLGHQNSKSDCSIISKDGRVDINPEEYSLLEVLYSGIAESDDSEEHTDPTLFYQGRCSLSWYGVKHEFAINRVVPYRIIKKRIQDAAIYTTSKVIDLKHEPGAGGTTLARMIAYELSKEMPVAIVKGYNDRLLPKQIENLYRKVSMSILIVAESSIITKEDLGRLIKELMSNGTPHVILNVDRKKRRGADKGTDADVHMMTDTEFNDLYDKLEPYMTDSQKESVREIVKRPEDRYPFYVSLYTFEDRFYGIAEYIRHFMIDIKDNDRDALMYIAMVDMFANRSLDVNFFTCVDESDPIGIFVDGINNSLVALETKGRNSYVKIRHARFAEEIINYQLGGPEVSRFDQANRLSDIIRSFIRYSKRQIMYDLDSTIDILKNLLILRDTDSLIRNRFAPIITYIRNMIPKDRKTDEYGCIGVIFKELVEIYPEEAHFKAHLSRYYTHIEENYLRGIEEAKGAIYLAESEGMHDSLLYHIAGMSIRKFVEKKLYKDAIDNHLRGEEQISAKTVQQIQLQLSEASDLFNKVRTTNNKVAGYISDIEMCIELIDNAKRYHNCTTEQLLVKYKDSWFMEYYDRALTLLEGFKNLRVEEETEFNQIRLSARTSESLQDMISNIEATVNMWETYLKHADDMRKPVVRRFIARAKQRTILTEKKPDQETIAYVMELMEENIKQEPENGANIRIWFNVLRYSENTNPEILLDDAINRLGSWKILGDNYEAYYYYFILICIKAIEGSSRAEALIPSLQEELKNKTAHMPNNRVIYEWLGYGKGVGRLISAYSMESGKEKKLSMDEVKDRAESIEGYITKYTSDKSAQIRAYNMEVFYSPSMQIIQTTPDDINKKVKFILGFSYDGLRALNKSVELINNDDLPIEESLIGKEVRCKVQGIDSTGKYLRVKLVDYRNKYGSIHKSEVNDGDSITNYVDVKELRAKVIDKRFNKKESKYYWQLSLKTECLDDWQKKLKSLKLDL